MACTAHRGRVGDGTCTCVGRAAIAKRALCARAARADRIRSEHEDLLVFRVARGEERRLQERREEHRQLGHAQHLLLIVQHRRAVTRDRLAILRLQNLDGVREGHALRVAERLALERLLKLEAGDGRRVDLIQVRVGFRQLRHRGRIHLALRAQHADVRQLIENFGAVEQPAPHVFEQADGRDDHLADGPR
eukprot:3427568-Prymnesium_polylepis.1